MNYYELKNFHSISVAELIKEFKVGNLIKQGCISIFNDSIGKPGDRTVELTNVGMDSDKLIFEFGKYEKIILNEPNNIVINSKVIGVQNCREIRWHLKDLELKYFINEDEVKTFATKGEHIFSVKGDSAPLLFYTW